MNILKLNLKILILTVENFYKFFLSIQIYFLEKDGLNHRNFAKIINFLKISIFNF